MTTVLFHRDFESPTGGHLAIWRYFRIVEETPGHRAEILFSPTTAWVDGNPWLGMRSRALRSRAECQPDLMLLAGLDWEILGPAEREHPPVPVINRIAHVRHASPDDVRHPYLRHPAIRICCSTEVRDAILRSGPVNGPIFVVPDGIGVDGMDPGMPWGHRPTDVFIGALKCPTMGLELAGLLRGEGFSVDLACSAVPRAEFLARVGRARVGVFLPMPTEGLFVPPLEAMALGTLAICPDIPGPRSYARDGCNGFFPAYHAAALHAAVLMALGLPRDAREDILERGRRTVAAHSVDQEAKSLREILRDARELWRELRASPAGVMRPTETEAET